MKHWTPRPYQVKATQHLLNHPGAGLFLEPGLGKTSCTLAAAEVFSRHKLGRILIIAPLRVCYSVWPAEARKWGCLLPVHVLHGANKADKLHLAGIHVINPEGLQWLTSFPVQYDVIVLDESTKFKNARTVRYANLEKLLKDAKRAIVLTGTPAANNLQDIWAQIKVLDGGERLGRYITHFRKQYFRPELIRVGGGRTVEIFHPRADTAERIQQKIQDICMYMRAEDYIDLPELVINRIDVDMPKSAWAVYEELSDELFTEVANNTISAANAAVKVNKLRQITGGQVYGDNGTEYLHTAKADALIDLLGETQGQPVLVACAFQHEAEALQHALKTEFRRDVPYLGGGISATKSDTIAAQWNRGELPVLLAHPASVAHGLNLQAGGHTVVWYTPTWSLEEYDQLIRRVYRSGQEHRVIVHHLVVPDSIDELVYEALQNKDKTQRGLLDLLKRKLDEQPQTA